MTEYDKNGEKVLTGDVLIASTGGGKDSRGGFSSIRIWEIFAASNMKCKEYSKFIKKMKQDEKKRVLQKPRDPELTH
jgi:hypothetical protein